MCPCYPCIFRPVFSKIKCVSFSSSFATEGVLQTRSSVLIVLRPVRFGGTKGILLIGVASRIIIQSVVHIFTFKRKIEKFTTQMKLLFNHNKFEGCIDIKFKGKVQTLCFSAFPQNCYNYNGPHSEDCLKFIWEDAGCLPNDKGFPYTITISRKQILRTTLK